MLWLKFWLETRWRMLMPLAMILFVLFQDHAKGHLQLSNVRLQAVMPMFWVLFPMMLAGSGILTETPFRAMKGTHASMYFTLSLPISRLRLLVARTAFGMFEMTCTVVFICSVAAIAFPEVRQHISLADGSRFVATTVLCNFAVFALATLFSTLLDQQWQVLATSASFFGARWLLGENWLLFRAMGQASPLVTHTMPWLAIGLSMGLAAVFFTISARVVETRQF